MPDSKLSALPAGAAPVDADLFYSDQSAASVKVTALQIKTYAAAGGGVAIGGAVTGGAPGSVLFVGAGPTLAQDNAKFFWDDTGFVLKVAGELDFQSATSTIKVNGNLELDFGATLAAAWTAANSFNLSSTANSYFIQGIPSLFVAPNVSGNNWFEAGGGNRTLTGYGNFGTGDGSLGSVTSGIQNVAVGRNALGDNLTGSQNVAIGTQAIWLTQSDSNNVAIGFNSLVTLGASGAGGGVNTGNLAVGFGALGNVSIASNNIVIGVNGLANIQAPTTASQNTIIGAAAGNSLGVGGGATVANNIFIGTNSGANITGATIQNTWIGGYQGPASTLGGRTMALSDGGGFWLFDFHLTTAVTWSMNYAPGLGIPTGLHIYNFQDAVGPAMTVYERACFDWNLTTNVFRIASQATGGAHPVRLIAIDGFQKAGAPAAGDLPSGTCALINDTSGGNTWLVYNAAGTIRKVQLV